MSNVSRKVAGSGTPQQILSVRKQQLLASVSGINTLLFLVVDATADLAAYSANYAAATGIYTVPAGGHKDVIVKASITFISGYEGLSVSTVSIVVDDIIRSQQAFSSTMNGQKTTLNPVFEIKTLTAGQQVKIVFGCGGMYSVYANEENTFQIFATR